MSTNLLYHAFGVRGYQQTTMRFADGAVRFFVQPSEKAVCCSACGSSDVLRRGFKDREFRAAPIGSKPTVIVATLPRVECRQCGTVRQIQVGFAEPRRTYTKGWAKYALELSKSMTIKDVADQLNVSWDVSKELKKTYLKMHFATPSLKDVRQIAIDDGRALQARQRTCGLHPPQGECVLQLRGEKNPLPTPRLVFFGLH